MYEQQETSVHTLITEIEATRKQLNPETYIEWSIAFLCWRFGGNAVHSSGGFHLRQQ